MIPLNLIIEDIHEHGFAIVDDFLPIEHFNALKEQAHSIFQKGLFKQARVGNAKNTVHHDSIRSDKIHWLEEDVQNLAYTSYFSAIKEIASQLNQAFFLGLCEYEAHFAMYQRGDFYKKHTDQFASTQDRKISCVYYLNNQWMPTFGGQLVLFDKQNTPIKEINPSPNRFICFCSELPHEVKPTHQTRYSITGWLKSRSLHPTIIVASSATISKENDLFVAKVS